MNKYINFIGNFSTLHSFYIVNKICNSYFKPQKINKYLIKPTNISKGLFIPINNLTFIIKYYSISEILLYYGNKYKESLILMLLKKNYLFKIQEFQYIIFDISKTQKEKETFFAKLIEYKIITIKYCLENYEVSEDFIEHYKDKINNKIFIIDRTIRNLSNKWILNNLDKIITSEFYEDKSRIFSQDEISQILDYCEKNPQQLIPDIFISHHFMNKKNLKKLNKIVIKNDLACKNYHNFFNKLYKK